MINELSIIIPTLNEEKYLPGLLTSLTRQDFRGKWEVIVVDGRSEDNTRNVALSYKKVLDNVSVIQSKRGISVQRNRGVRHAKYNHLLFLDADTILPDSFLSKLSKRIDHKDEAFVGLPLLIPMPTTVVDYFGVGIAYTFFLLVGKFNPIVAGLSLITTRKNHERIGGFNEEVIYAEDLDYGLRSFKNGARYYLYARLHLFASARRAKEMGRVKLCMLWVSWYLKLVKNGAMPEQSPHEYPYGQYGS